MTDQKTAWIYCPDCGPDHLCGASTCCNPEAPHNLNIDGKCEIVENALYRLKERDYLTPERVRAIDDFMGAVGAEALADLYDLLRFHKGPEA